MAAQYARLDLHGEMLGDDEVVELLLTVRRRSRDLRPVFEEFGDYYAAFHFFRFMRSGQFIGTKRWAPLNPKYKAKKTAKYGARPILVRSGKLFESLNHRPFDVDRVGKRTAEFGTSVKYARFHQTGTRFMPKRSVIPPLTKAQLRLLDKIVVDHLLPMELVRELRGAA